MITREVVYDKVVEVLRDELLFDGEFKSDTSINNLGLDSIQIMQLFVYMEEIFGFEFPEDSMMESVRESSLGQFANYVHKALGQGQ